MDKGFGIAALILAILAIFIPVVGIYVSGLALVLAAIGALAGDRIFAVATPLIAAVNTFPFSPSTWILIDGSGREGWRGGLVGVILAFLAAPIVSIMLNASGKIAINRRSAR